MEDLGSEENRDGEGMFFGIGAGCFMEGYLYFLKMFRGKTIFSTEGPCGKCQSLSPSNLQGAVPFSISGILGVQGGEGTGGWECLGRDQRGKI